MLSWHVQATLLLEEGFNYTAGTGLAANSPWAGSSGTSVSVASGSLSLTALRPTVPAGNMMQVGGGTSRTVYRNFSSNAVTGGTVYCSALIRCIQPPTSSQFIASLMPTGSTSHNRDTDPIDLNVVASTNGFNFSLSSAGGDAATGRQGLTTNSTHLIVLKYIFGSAGQVRLFVDPVPGGTEPTTATISPETGDNGTGAANLQVLMFQSSSSTGQGVFNFDTIRVGTNWADVTPIPNLLSLAGPLDQAVCFGSGASFSVTATGTPPFKYQWRTNGIAVINATNGSFTLNNPSGADTLKNFDVVVNDSFGAITSRVAKLSFSTNAASIVTAPASQLVMPGDASATFSAAVAGDAPLSLQWRANGVAIPGATNSSYTLNNPSPTDAATAFDLVASTPCGSVTSAPPVGVYFPNIFYTGFDSGAGFFGGENLIFTNTSGLNFSVWSSPDLAISVTNWSFEGLMSELPLGTSGESRYGINLNPVISPVYYILAQTNTGPYTATEPLVWLTTDDFVSFTVTSSNLTISAAGIFNQNSFNLAFDGGSGFFGGENLIFTNNSGITFCAWSSPDLSVSVTNWTFEGPMSELPLGVSGQSRYGINLNPVTSPVYYIFAETNTGNFTPAEPLVWLTTSDFASFSVDSSNMPISLAGIFAIPVPPMITQSPSNQTVLAGQNAAFSVLATGSGLGYQWFLNNNAINSAIGSIINVTNASAMSAGNYTVVVTNASGTATSAIATLSVSLPPALKTIPSPPGSLQLTAQSFAGLTYVVETSTNLFPPAWWPVLTNTTGNDGLVHFQTNAVSAGWKFYRLVFP